MTTARPRIAVVGAGIVGTCVAWHLARAGAAITLVDGEPPGSGVTMRAFGWITVAHGLADDYARLRATAIADWHRVECELAPRLAPDWCGAITWTDDPARTESFVCVHAERGRNVRLIDGEEAARLEPGLTDWPECVAFAEDEGAIDAAAAARCFAEAAADSGATVRIGDPVTAIETRSGRVAGIRIAAEHLPADAVVLAAGTGVTALTDPLGLNLGVSASPAILIRLHAPSACLRRIVSGTEFEARQAGPHLIFAAEDYTDDCPENGPEAVARRTRDALRVRLADERIEIESVTVGWRPMPPGGLPVTGFAPGIDGLYLAVMHAGVTLAPAIARIATDEMMAALG